MKMWWEGGAGDHYLKWVFNVKFLPLAINFNILLQNLCDFLGLFMFLCVSKIFCVVLYCFCRKTNAEWVLHKQSYLIDTLLCISEIIHKNKFIQSIIKIQTKATFIGSVCTMYIEYPFLNSFLNYFNFIGEVILGTVSMYSKIHWVNPCELIQHRIPINLYRILHNVLQSCLGNWYIKLFIFNQ